MHSRLTNYKSSNQFLRVFQYIAFILSFILPAILAVNVTFNHFYTIGGVVLDSGWFAYLSTHATSWPLPNPPLIGGTYFATHVSLIFYLYSILYKILVGAGVLLPNVVFFSLTQSFWFGLLSLAAYGLLLPIHAVRKESQIILAWLFALLVTLNGISLSMLIFPHFEIAMPALLLSFFALWSHRYKKLCIISLLLGLLIREDAGLHYFGVFILLSISLYFFTSKPELRQHIKYFFSLAILCLSYSIIIIALQKHFYHLHTLSGVYLGTPLFHHVTRSFIDQKIHFFLIYRTYIYIPLIGCLILAYFQRCILLAMGAFFVIPWIALAFFAFSPDAGRLVFYYSFPILIALLWPAIVYALEKNTAPAKKSYFFYWSQASAIIFLSFITFWFFPRDVSHQLLKTSCSFEWLAHWKNNQKILDELFEKNNLSQDFMVDNAIGAIEINKITSQNFYFTIEDVPKNRFNTIEALVFLPNSIHDKTTTQEIIRLAHLNIICSLTDSDYSLATKKGVYADLCQ